MLINKIGIYKVQALAKCVPIKGDFNVEKNEIYDATLSKIKKEVICIRKGNL